MVPKGDCLMNMLGTHSNSTLSVSTQLAVVKRVNGRAHFRKDALVQDNKMKNYKAIDKSDFIKF